MFLAALVPYRIGWVFEDLLPESRSIRPVRLGALHCTILFLGDQPDAVPLVGLVDALASFPPTVVTAGPSTAWMGRALCVPVAGLEEIAGEARRIWGTTESGGAFRGHATIGRLRRGGVPSARLTGVACHASWVVERVSLMESVLGPGGPRYEVLHEATLSSQGLRDRT